MLLQNQFHIAELWRRKTTKWADMTMGYVGLSQKGVPHLQSKQAAIWHLVPTSFFEMAAQGMNKNPRRVQLVENVSPNPARPAPRTLAEGGTLCTKSSLSLDLSRLTEAITPDTTSKTQWTVVAHKRPRKKDRSKSAAAICFAICNSVVAAK